MRPEISRAHIRDPAQQFFNSIGNTGSPLGPLIATRATCNAYILDF